MKKRILSLILALSMVLSVFPLGAFAAPLPELVMKNGLPDLTGLTELQNGMYIGDNWGYDSNTGTLSLTYGTFDFSSTHPQGKTLGTPTTTPVACAIKIESGAEITGGTFNATVDNGTWNRPGGTISNGIFNGGVTNSNTIKNGTFEGSVANSGTIEKGTFNEDVTNRGTINNGTFAANKEVTNYGTINNGTFAGNVRNEGTIEKGTFEDSVINVGTINNGSLERNVQNDYEGKIFGGAFSSTVGNYHGTISGGTFAAGLSWNNGSVTGGIFNGNANLTGVTGLHSITVAPGAKITEVNDVPADWKPYAYEGKTVTIKANTDIYSLNDQPIVDGNCKSSYDGSNKTIVKFTMPNRNVVLGTGDLVMKYGYPIGSNNGTNNCEGKGWEDIKKDQSDPTNTGKLILKSGTYNFSYTYPQNPNKGNGAEPVKCAIVTQSGVEITGGTFNAIVYNGQNSPGGIISNGTFNGEVRNHAGTISGGKFEGTVINNVSGTISDGTFNKAVSNYMGTISDGTFNATVTNYGDGKISDGTFNGTVENKKGTIMKGTFKGKVTNDQGSIYAGTFAAGLSLSENPGHIYHGVFNGKTGLTTKAHKVTVTNGSVSQVNGEGPLNADGTPGTAWDLYAYAGTTVTIIASTEIFSLNGRPIGAGNCNSSYGVDKKTVKFTMPDGPVVLNGAITCTDLVMKDGWPEASNNGTDKGTISCSGNGWSYDSSTKTLTLTDGTFGFSSTEPVQCAILLDSENAEITGGTFEADVKNNDGGTISDGTFNGTVKNNGGKISSGTFNGTVQHGYGTISGGTFHEKVLNSHGEITGGTFAAGLSANNGAVTGGVFNGDAYITGVTGGHFIKWDDDYSKANPNAKIEKVNGVSANWAPYVVVTELTTATAKEVTITADTEIFSLNGRLLGADDRVNGDKKTVKFTMPDDMPDNENVVLNKAITSTDLVMENGWPKDSNGGTIPCKGDGWQYIPNDPTNGDMLLLTGSNQTGGLYDFSTIGDGSPVECNVFVGKPTAITGGVFDGKVFNNSGILGGTFNGEVDNRAPGIIKDGTFNGAVENNGIIEKGTFNGAVTGSGTVSESITGSGTLNGELITKTPEPKPEPEPTTYTVTVIGGTIDGKTSVSAKENDTLTVVLDQNDIPDGMTFDLWSISSDKLSGDINVDYRAEAMTFQMPAEDVTIRAQYRSAEIIEDAAPSPLATAATIAVGGAAAGIVVWQGVSLGVDLYLANALPQGVPVPTDRRALALLLWETAGKPEVALPTLYGDIPTEEIELQKATRWAVQNGLMDAADKKDASFFDPDHYVTKMDVFGAWLRLKKLIGTT